MIAGEDNALVQHNRLAFAGKFHFRVARYAAGSGCGAINVGVNQTELQRRGRAENLFRTRRILNTRQFDHNTVGALALNQRFGNAQLVYTVTQDSNVLLNGIFAGFFQTVVGHHGFQASAALSGDNQIAVARAKVGDSLVARGAIAEGDAQTVVVFFTHGGVRNAFITQFAAQAVDILFLQFAQRGVHVDFHQEVHAAAQVKTQLHRLGVKGRQPARGCRSKVKRHDVFVTQHAHQRFARAQLDIGGVEARKNCALFQCHRLRGNFFFL